MKDWQSQAHVKWECKYHVVIVPKYRKKTIYGKPRHHLGQLCGHKEIELLETHAMADHVHMLLSVSPRYSIARKLIASFSKRVPIRRHSLSQPTHCSMTERLR